MTTKELAAATGRHRTTVERKLKMLRDDVGEFAMVDQGTDGRWGFTADADLDTVARELGTDGASARQRRDHIRQRAAYAHARARYGQEEVD